MKQDKQLAMKEKYGDERVFCIPTHALTTPSGTDPILYTTKEVLNCMEQCGEFRLRWEVELDDSWKQVIPYVLLYTEEAILTAKRLKGDPRLTGGYTVGMGGHLNPEDEQSDQMTESIEHCIKRELGEETSFEWERDLVSYQMHDSSFVSVGNEVSRMHICIPVWMRVRNSSNIMIREVDKLLGEWTPHSQIRELKGRLEGWSEIALNLWEKR